MLREALMVASGRVAVRDFVRSGAVLPWHWWVWLNRGTVLKIG
jgi:hypothetical protein